MSPDRPKREILAPPYYKSFQCIADRCRHSCCIDWEICIDEGTMAKYRSLPAVMDTVTETADGPCFALGADGRCPHLNAAGLCDIILSHGGEYLSDICSNHPRFFHDVGGRREAGLGLVCEEACRLILEDERPFSLIKAGEVEECGEEPAADFDPLPRRDAIIATVEKEGSLDRALAALRSQYGIADSEPLEAWLDRLLDLEMLEEDWGKTLLRAKGAPPHTYDAAAFEPYFCRLLIYFLYRHVSEATSLQNLRARLGFAMVSAKLVRYLWEREPAPDREALFDLARRYSGEIEYSEDNTDELIFAFECRI